MMCLAIDIPTSCKICAVIHSIHAKNISAEEIHRELCVIYGTTVMSEGTVRRWYRLFKDGRRDVHDEVRSDRPAVYSE
jgi:transposase